MIFIRRIRFVSQKYLEADMLCLDPEFKHLAIYDSCLANVYVLTPIMLIHHIIDYKNKFETSHSHPLPSLPVSRMINLKKDCGLTNIRFTAMEVGTVLVIGYCDGNFQVYSLAKNWSLYKKFSSNVQALVDFVFSKSIMYTLDYGGEIRGHNLIKGKPVEVTVEQGIGMFSTKDGLLIQTQSGDLLDDTNKKLLQGNREKLITVSRTVHHPRLFEMGFLSNYLYHREQKCLYKLDTMQKKVFEHYWSVMEISPFEYTKGTIALIGQETDLILINLQTGVQYLKIKNLKHPVCKIVWLGPYQILLLDQNQVLYYLELFCDQVEAS